MATYQFIVTVEVERESGKFASRDEITSQITEALGDVDIDLDGIGADGDSIYNVEDISVDEYVQPKKAKTTP